MFLCVDEKESSVTFPKLHRVSTLWNSQSTGPTPTQLTTTLIRLRSFLWWRDTLKWMRRDVILSLTREIWEAFMKEKVWVLRVKEGFSRMMRGTHSVWGAQRKQRGEDIESTAWREHGVPWPGGNGGPGRDTGDSVHTVSSLEYRGTFIQWVARNCWRVF